MSAKTPVLATKRRPLGKPGGPGLFHDKRLELPPYVQNIAHSLMRKRGLSKSRAIQLALGAVERWKNGGGDVSPEVRAAAAKAWAQWEAAKAKARATPNKSEHSNDAHALDSLLSGPDGGRELLLAASQAGVIDLAALQQWKRGRSAPRPRQVSLSSQPHQVVELSQATHQDQEGTGSSMTTQILSPIDLGEAKRLGSRLFRKQVLPYGSINYKDKSGAERVINFTREMFTAMEQAFRDKAYPGVPLVFADKDNGHTMHPLATTGEVVDLEITDNGLDLIVRADEEAAKLLANYPNIGISARIFENIERADGKRYDAALQHALITWDPKVSDLKPWEAVNLSAEAGDVLDLSAETFAPAGGGQEGATMPAPFTDEETTLLRQLLAKIQDEGKDSDEDEPTDSAGEEIPELTDEELNALAAEVLGEGNEPASEPQATEDSAHEEQGSRTEETGEQAAEEQLEAIAASNDAPAVELANARVAEMETQLSNLQAELDKRNFEAERDKLASEYGIPPAVTDLARPLLQGRQVIELSNGSNVDAGQVVREVLQAVGQQFRLLDLSQSVGSAFETDQDKAEADDRTRWVKATIDSLGLS